MSVSNASGNFPRRIILSVRITYGQDGEPFYRIDAESDLGRLSVFDRNRAVALRRIFRAMRDAWAKPGECTPSTPCDA